MLIKMRMNIFGDSGHDVRRKGKSKIRNNDRDPGPKFGSNI